MRDLDLYIRFLVKARDFLKSNSEESLNEFREFYEKNLVLKDIPRLWYIIGSSELDPKYMENIPLPTSLDGPFKVNFGKSAKSLEILVRLNNLTGRYYLFGEFDSKLIILSLYLNDIIYKLDKICYRKIKLIRKAAPLEKENCSDTLNSRIIFLKNKVELVSNYLYKIVYGEEKGSGNYLDLDEINRKVIKLLKTAFGEGLISWKERFQSIIGAYDSSVKDSKKMFSFSQDRWVKTTLTDRFEVEASSYEEAVNIVKGVDVKDLRKSGDERIRFIETESLDEEDDISLISFTESCGKPTINVYGYDTDGSIDRVKDNREEFRNGRN